MIIWILALGIAYLLGSIPFGYLLVRYFRKEDIRNTGSGNIGATNVARSGAKGLGALTLLLDAFKGFVAVAIAQHLFAPHLGYPAGYKLAAAAGLFAVLGHVFPLWLRFEGGKGVATALGVFLALAPFAALCGLLVFIVTLALTQYVSLGSIIGSLVLAAVAIGWNNKHSLFIDLCYLIIVLLVIAKHHQNIRRLASGTENRFSTKKSA
ncbi:MAG: glycerol-3-phosphate 1-O-acyltransferase PlsY [Acidobacteria bacterium]|nr:glycerol-3-phosphate 1-O-acyltransferase PlsY [Acidobacteriota bacterium]